MAGVFLKRDFYLSIFFARRMKKNKHEFLACARHARLPLQIWFFAFTTFTISQQNMGWVFLRPPFPFEVHFRAIFRPKSSVVWRLWKWKNKNLCNACARHAREGVSLSTLSSLFFWLSLSCKNKSHVLKIFSESFPKNSHVFQKISNVFQRISDVFGISPTFLEYLRRIILIKHHRFGL